MSFSVVNDSVWKRCGKRWLGGYVVQLVYAVLRNCENCGWLLMIIYIASNEFRWKFCLCVCRDIPSSNKTSKCISPNVLIEWFNSRVAEQKNTQLRMRKTRCAHSSRTNKHLNKSMLCKCVLYEFLFRNDAIPIVLYSCVVVSKALCTQRRLHNGTNTWALCVQRKDRWNVATLGGGYIDSHCWWGVWLSSSSGEEMLVQEGCVAVRWWSDRWW